MCVCVCVCASWSGCLRYLLDGLVSVNQFYLSLVLICLHTVSGLKDFRLRRDKIWPDKWRACILMYVHVDTFMS